jgi:hypothetical protein
MKIGTVVGARRWPYSYAHGDAGERPWAGVLLANNDPLAWTDTLAFPNRCPSQAEVDAHLARLASLGLDMSDETPVIWAFERGPTVQWERREALRPYAEDVAKWAIERARAR